MMKNLQTPNTSNPKQQRKLVLTAGDEANQQRENASFIEILANMPNVGEDADFARSGASARITSPDGST